MSYRQTVMPSYSSICLASPSIIASICGSSSVGNHNKLLQLIYKEKEKQIEGGSKREREEGRVFVWYGAIIKLTSVGSWHGAGATVASRTRLKRVLNFYLWHLINILINCGQLSVRIALHPAACHAPLPTSATRPSCLCCCKAYRLTTGRNLERRRQLNKCRTLRLRHKHFSTLRIRNLLCACQYVCVCARVSVCAFNMPVNCNLSAAN